MPMIWTLKHPQATTAMLGYIPSFLNENDPRPAREQIDANYRHGGGWSPFKGHTMVEGALEYPNDPPMVLLAETRLRDEIIRVYDASWVAVVQADGGYEVARLD